jgi:hypothetical protein
MHCEAGRETRRRLIHSWEDYMRRFCYLTVAMLAITRPVCAQDHATMDHSRMKSVGDSLTPTLPGQDAYGAISEVVRLLQSDPTTDWSKVNIEALRQHLIDMNSVTLRSSVRQTIVPGGIQMLVTGDPSVQGAIRRMTVAHGMSLRALGLVGVSTPVVGGASFTVTATDTTNNALLAQVRGLGFAGLMTLGNHHAAHHLAIARGQSMSGHAMD